MGTLFRALRKVQDRIGFRGQELLGITTFLLSVPQEQNQALTRVMVFNVHNSSEQLGKLLKVTQLKTDSQGLVPRHFEAG